MKAGCMKKRRFLSGALVLAVTMMFAGCGEQVYDLTEEERAAVVQYSAHVVTKFNKEQPEGIRDVAALEAEMALEAEQEKEDEKEKEPEVDSAADDAAADDAPADNGAQENTQQDAAEPGVSYVSLNQALQLGGVDAVYRDYELTDQYAETESYAVSANSGNTLLILHIRLKNNSSRAADCNILAKLPVFNLKINGEVSTASDVTILLNDLSTYEGSIAAGEAADTVLVFQVRKGSLGGIKTMDLDVTVGETTSTVQLIGG